jgi:hypothetical protein
MHGLNENARSIYSASNITYHNKPGAYNPVSTIEETLKPVLDFAELQNKMSNSSQASNYLNSIESQVNSLRERMASYDKRISDLYSYNLVFPKGAAQGISGYICKKCQTFSFKAIFDPGYDMTMESRHRCNESDYKRSYTVIPIPSGVPDVDDWIAQCLLDQINFYIPIGKYLVATDMTKCLNDFSTISNAEIAQGIVGVPDRFPFYSFKNSSKTDWIDRAIDNLNKKIVMTDFELLDFFRKVKATYGIFEIPIGENVRQFFMFLTNY